MIQIDDDRRSRVMSRLSDSSRAPPSQRHSEVTKIDDFSFGNANSSQQDASRTLNWRDPGKHRPL
jgi:hypothetical protein